MDFITVSYLNSMKRVTEWLINVNAIQSVRFEDDGVWLNVDGESDSIMINEDKETLIEKLKVTGRCWG